MAAVKRKTQSETSKSIIRKDDIVEVRAGKDRGKRGRVLRVFAQEGRIIIESIW